MTTPKVFTSYSHEDEPWKERLVRHLRRLERQGTVYVFDTSVMPAGADWSNEIKNAVSA